MGIHVVVRATLWQVAHGCNRFGYHPVVPITSKVGSLYRAAVIRERHLANLATFFDLGRWEVRSYRWCIPRVHQVRYATARGCGLTYTVSFLKNPRFRACAARLTHARTVTTASSVRG